MKKFFGGMFIEQEVLRKEGIYHPIKLEYYKEIKNNDNNIKNLRYGVEIIKTEYYPNSVRIEKKETRGLTNDEKLIEELLGILKVNRVTPVSMKDVIMEIFTKDLQIVEK